MSSHSDKNVNKYVYTQNRELSWLRFNKRVLEEAADASVPLFERLKFISIFTSNLDEFFMVRVGSLFDLSTISPEEVDNKTGMTPKEQLEHIYGFIPGLIDLKDRLYHSVMELLEETGIRDLSAETQSAEERKYINQYFKTKILPILSPQIVDSHHPFPHLANKKLYIAAQLRDKKGNVSLGLIPLPAAPPPLSAFRNSPATISEWKILFSSGRQPYLGITKWTVRACYASHEMPISGLMRKSSKTTILIFATV